MIGAFYRSLIGMVALSGGLAEAVTVFAPLNSQDRIVGFGDAGIPAGYYPSVTDTLIVGSTGSAGARRVANAVLGFSLPALNPGESIESATFRITISEVNAATAISLSLFGLTTTNPTAADFNQTNTDALNPAFASSSVDPVGTVKSSDVTAFINSLYTGATPDQAEVFFRINHNAVLNNNSPVRRINFGIGTAQLEFSVVPEPSSVTAAGSMAGFLMMRRRRVK